MEELLQNSSVTRMVEPLGQGICRGPCVKINNYMCVCVCVHLEAENKIYIKIVSALFLEGPSNFKAKTIYASKFDIHRRDVILIADFYWPIGVNIRRRTKANNSSHPSQIIHKCGTFVRGSLRALADMHTVVQ